MKKRNILWSTRSQDVNQLQIRYEYRPYPMVKVISSKWLAFHVKKCRVRRGLPHEFVEVFLTRSTRSQDVNQLQIRYEYRPFMVKVISSKWLAFHVKKCVVRKDSLTHSSEL